MPVLGLPLLLVGLVGLPMLAGIYWLRTRYRRQDVSTLFLWQSAVQAQGGGRKKSRLQTPLTLLFELLVIVLLVLAATAPRVLRAGQTASVIVVLDDSYSMQAIDGEGVSSQTRAIEALRKELNRLPKYTVRLITAGIEPQVLGKPATSWAEVSASLEGWLCQAPVSDIDGALALAGEIGGPRSRQLVLSDHAMPQRYQEDISEEVDEQSGESEPVADEAGWGRMRWLAVGAAQNNVAVSHAVRSRDAVHGDTVLVELVNHGELPVTGRMTLSAGTKEADFASDVSTPAIGDSLEFLDQRRVELLPGETKRLWLKPLKAAERSLVVSLQEDSLAADNQVVLMPIESRPLSVSVELKDESLRQAVTQAVEASGRAVVVGQGADLVFTDQPLNANASTRSAAWVVRFDRGDPAVQDQAAQAYLGPFVIDYDHPLAQGLSLTGLVWSVAPAQAGEGDTPGSQRGRPIVTAGDQVLLRDETKRGAQHILTWRIWPERSTVMQSAAFPILVWNIIEWRRSERPGVSPVNVRPGVPIAITTSTSQGEVRVRRVHEVASGGDENEDSDEANLFSIVDRRASFLPERPGVYEIQTPSKRYRVAVNGGSQAESNLLHAGADVFGRWDDQIAIEREYQGLGWLLGVLALGLLGLHAFWLDRGAQHPAAGPLDTNAEVAS